MEPVGKLLSPALGFFVFLEFVAIHFLPCFVLGVLDGFCADSPFGFLILLDILEDF